MAPQVQLVVVVSAFVKVIIVFGQCHVCCSSTHGAHPLRAQPFVKVGGGHVPPYLIEPATVRTGPGRKRHLWLITVFIDFSLLNV